MAKIRYYAVGEYGGNTGRPHYHLIIFNAQADNIPKAWTLGHTHIGTVANASVSYSLKYITKAPTSGKHVRDDRAKEFSLMSKGLGANYLTHDMKRWHKQSVHDRVYCVTRDGHKISMPRYYKDKIYLLNEKAVIQAYQNYLAENEYLGKSFEEIVAIAKKEQLIAIEKIRQGNKADKRPGKI